MSKTINGFSKLSKEQKINWVATKYFSNPKEAIDLLKKYWNQDQILQKLHDEFVENSLTNFYLPLGVAPNFLINGILKTIPMAIEESSVIAAASNAAKFWLNRGGFRASVINTEKIGHVHFLYEGDSKKIQDFFSSIKSKLFLDTENITKKMRERGGGILDIILKNKTNLIPNYYQLEASFETKDSMGANFINSCLEQFSKTLKESAESYESFSAKEKSIEIIMSILSNYVPNCIVKAEVSCKLEELNVNKNISAELFAEKFIKAVQIAEIEPYRAVTHNKGIMNGVDAVAIATGNDFRAIEAGVHAYASRNGQYSSLSHAEIKNGIFSFWLEIPLALGIVGGLTSLHPLVKLSLEMLERPSAKELMEIIAVAGLAQNFAALCSLTTTGIQQGHMKMHLVNILNPLQVSDREKLAAIEYFKDNTISHPAVIEFIENYRKL